MFCERCGTQIPNGAKFCEKCGAPVEPELQEQKEGVLHKKWLIGGIIGGIVIVAVAVGVVFATGILGGKDEAVQTDTDTVVAQETPNVIGDAVGGTETVEGQSEQEGQKADATDARDKVWDAYVAYKAYLKGKEEENGNDEYYREYMEKSQFSLIYLDEDDYPELLIINHGSRAGESYIYTYQNGDVCVAYIECAVESYQEKQAYLYNTSWAASGLSAIQTIYQFESKSIRELSSDTITNTEDWSQEKGRVEMGKKIGIESEDWSDIECKDSLEEAYILLQNK